MCLTVLWFLSIVVVLNMFSSNKKTSEVWNHFVDIGQFQATCNLCEEKYSFKTSVSNLKKHLSRKHKIHLGGNPVANTSSDGVIIAETSESAENLTQHLTEVEAAKEAATANATDSARAKQLEAKLKETEAAYSLCRQERDELERRLRFSPQQLNTYTANAALARSTAENGVSGNYLNSQPSTSFAVNPQPQGLSSDQVTVDESGPSKRPKISPVEELCRRLQIESHEFEILRAYYKLMSLTFSKFSDESFEELKTDIKDILKFRKEECKSINCYTQNNIEKLSLASVNNDNKYEIFSHWVIYQMTEYLTDFFRQMCIDQIMFCTYNAISSARMNQSSPSHVNQKILIAYGKLIALHFGQCGDNIDTFLELKKPILRILYKYRLMSLYQKSNQSTNEEISLNEFINCDGPFDIFSLYVIHELSHMKDALRQESMSLIIRLINKHRLRMIKDRNSEDESDENDESDDILQEHSEGGMDNQFRKQLSFQESVENILGVKHIQVFPTSQLNDDLDNLNLSEFPDDDLFSK